MISPCEGISEEYQAKLEKLKRDWLNDPCFDIWQADGFERHQEHLKDFQKRHEKKWKDAQNDKLQKKAVQIGMPGNLQLANYINFLERRIKKLEEPLS